jgi:hypothetical protein
MANVRYKVGPGSLVFGEVGSEQTIEAQILEATVEPDVESEDDELVLSGEVIPGEEEFTATLKFKCIQDIKTNGIVRWSWTNKGEVVPFVFIPNTVEDTQITGEVKVRPLTVGGEVGKRADSDVEFPCVGFPSIGDVP